jgi:hypothetical protein
MYAKTYHFMIIFDVGKGDRVSFLLVDGEKSWSILKAALHVSS